MHIPNNYITPATSQNYIWHPIANKLYSLNCWYYSVVYQKTCSQFMIFISFSIEKYKPPALTVPPLSHPTSCTPTKSCYFSGCCCKRIWVIQTPYIPCTKSHVPFHCLCSVWPESYVYVSLQGQIFTVRIVSTSPSPQAGGPPLVVCPRLLI